MPLCDYRVAMRSPDGVSYDPNGYFCPRRSESCFNSVQEGALVGSLASALKWTSSKSGYNLFNLRYYFVDSCEGNCSDAEHQKPAGQVRPPPSRYRIPYLGYGYTAPMVHSHS